LTILRVDVKANHMVKHVLEFHQNGRTAIS